VPLYAPSGSGVHSNSYPMGIGVLSLGVEFPHRGFMASCLVKSTGKTLPVLLPTSCSSSLSISLSTLFQDSCNIVVPHSKRPVSHPNKHMAKLILKDSAFGNLQSNLLFFFFTVSTVQYFKKQTNKEHNVSGTGCAPIFR
jgi:hypothetical protein